MTKFNFENIYEDRIRQIEIDMKKTIYRKQWSKLNLLKVEKVRLEKLIKEMN